MTDSADTPHQNIETTAEIVAAYVSRNSVPVAELPNLIRSVHNTLSGLEQAPAPEIAAEPLKPAVPIKKSVTDEFIIRPGRRAQAQIHEALPSRPRHDARRLSNQVEPAEGLSDGGARLCVEAQ